MAPMVSSLKEELKDLEKSEGETGLEGNMMDCIKFEVTSRQQSSNIQVPVLNQSPGKKLGRKTEI